MLVNEIGSIQKFAARVETKLKGQWQNTNSRTDREPTTHPVPEPKHSSYTKLGCLI